MDNDAFFDGNGNTLQGPEIARILRSYADDCEGDNRLPRTKESIYDINGNSVGVVEVAY